MVKVLLFGYFGTGSFGDDLILRAAINNYHNYLDFFQGKSCEPEFIVILRKDYIKFDLGSNVRKLTIKDLTKLFYYLFASDILWIPGGGIFNSRNYATYFLIFILTLVFKIFGKKVFFTSVEVSQGISFLQKVILKLLVKLSNQFTVRDTKSKDLLNDLKVRHQDEIVFSWIKSVDSCISSINKIKNRNNQAIVAVNGRIENLSSFLFAIKKFVLVHNVDKIFFVEFSKADNDLHKINLISENLNKDSLFQKNPISFVPYEQISSKEIESILSFFCESTYIISERYHGAILGMALGKEVFIVPHLDKLLRLKQTFETKKVELLISSSAADNNQ